MLQNVMYVGNVRISGDYYKNIKSKNETGYLDLFRWFYNGGGGIYCPYYDVGSISHIWYADLFLAFIGYYGSHHIPHHSQDIRNFSVICGTYRRLYLFRDYVIVTLLLSAFILSDDDSFGNNGCGRHVER